jgi:hypothetical protein
VAEEQTAVIKDFHIILRIKSLIDPYAGLVLSHSIEIGEAVAAGLGSISPDNWAVEISRTGRKQTGVPASTSREAASRVRFPLNVTIRANHALMSSGDLNGSTQHLLEVYCRSLNSQTRSRA